MSEYDVMTRLLVQAAVMKELRAAVDETRAAAADELEPGDKKAPRLGGAKIGTVSLSDPDPEPVIVNTRELDEWIEQRRPDLVPAGDGYPQVDTSRIAEVVEILSRYAPYLLLPATETGIPEWARAQAVRDAVTDGEVPPGVELRAKSPVLSVRPNADATIVARRVLASSQLLELEAGEPR